MENFSFPHVTIVLLTWLWTNRCNGNTPCAACLQAETDCTYGSEANSYAPLPPAATYMYTRPLAPVPKLTK